MRMFKVSDVLVDKCELALCELCRVAQFVEHIKLGLPVCHA